MSWLRHTTYFAGDQIAAVRGNTPAALYYNGSIVMTGQVHDDAVHNTHPQLSVIETAAAAAAAMLRLTSFI